MLESTWTALKHHQRGVKLLLSSPVSGLRMCYSVWAWDGWWGAEPVGSQPTDEGTPQRVRRALEALGPTFVKLGQILASRGDILPALWIEELENLHSGAATLTWEQLQGQVLEDLGAELDQVFAEFNTTPLAAASIARSIGRACSVVRTWWSKFSALGCDVK